MMSQILGDHPTRGAIRKVFVHKAIAFLGAMLVFANSNPALGASFHDSLDFKSLLDAAEATHQNVGAVIVYNDVLVSVPRTGKSFMLTPFGTPPAANKALEAPVAANPSLFGEVKYGTFGFEPGERAEWVGGVSQMRNTMMFLESTDSRVAVMEYPSGFLVSQRAIVLDRLLPAKDSRGEAPKLEVASYRKKFMKAFGHINDGTIKLSGIAPLPVAWREGDKNQFLLGSRIPGFPLMTMHCLEDGLSQCIVMRGCFTEGTAGLNPDSLSGLATSPARRLVLIGDRLRARIVVLRFVTCHNVVRVGEIALPYQLKEMSNISIDQEDRLWITTLAPDDYRNSNIYVWAAKDW